MKIPVLPISYGDAQPLLAAITGRLAPADWRGALPITYRIGPGEATVHLSLAFNWTVTPLYNVIARLPGTTYRRRVDPARQSPRRLGERRRGSGERHGRRARGGARAGRAAPARLGAQAHHRLHRLGRRGAGAAGVDRARGGPGRRAAATRRGLHQHRQQQPRLPRAWAGRTRSKASSTTSRATSQDPEAGVSVWKRAQARRIVSGTPAERTDARSRAQLRIDALGSGSDYTPFLQHAGIASLNLGFGGEDEAGIYHSVYDSFHHYTQFQDRDFVYGRALAQTVGTAVIRLADADRLPFDFTGLADTVTGYVKELQDLVQDACRTTSRERARQLDEGDCSRPSTIRAGRCRRRPRLPLPPALNFAPLENAVTALTGQRRPVPEGGSGRRPPPRPTWCGGSTPGSGTPSGS